MSIVLCKEPNFSFYSPFPNVKRRQKYLNRTQAVKAIRAMGMNVKVVDGEFRVNYPKGAESTAYYTDDPEDAVGTARVMARSKTMRKANGQYGIFGA